MNGPRLLVVASFAVVFMQPPARSPPRALWLWDPKPFLSRGNAQADFFNF